MIVLTEKEKLVLNEYVNCNLSLNKTADALFYHRNTVTYYLNRIQEKYEVNLHNFYDLCKLLGYKKVEEGGTE